MKKLLYFTLLLATMGLLTSCESEVVEAPLGTYVPLGVEILAWIGFASVVLVMLVFILSFGGEPPSFPPRGED